MPRPRARKPLHARWAAKVRWTPTCWVWEGSTSRTRYGALYGALLAGGSEFIGAHRAAYVIFKGPIPDGYQIDHLCRNTLCVNPDHLEAVTRLENVRRATPFKKRTLTTVCSRGHLRTAANTYVYPSNGKRVCRLCKQLSKKRLRLAHAA